jgi:hypothetical protein
MVKARATAMAEAPAKPATKGLVVAKPFDRYVLQYYGGTSLQDREPGADIHCYSAATFVGSIRFFRDDATTPANSLGSDGTINLYYEMSRYNDVITTLRYEKPLQLVVNTASGFGYIGSKEMEPTGEQEAV